MKNFTFYLSVVFYIQDSVMLKQTRFTLLPTRKPKVFLKRTEIYS